MIINYNNNFKYNNNKKNKLFKIIKILLKYNFNKK